jgi:hypothetical protein
LIEDIYLKSFGSEFYNKGVVQIGSITADLEIEEFTTTKATEVMERL